MNLQKFNLKKLSLLAALILPAILLCTMLIQPFLTNWLGTPVYLSTKPVDPRDLFRGDYVMLSLNIQDLDIKKTPITGVSDPYKLQGKTLYVTLSPQNGLHEVTSASLTKPTASLYLKGRVSSVFNDNSINSSQDSWKISVDYGIDSYYVPEGTGKTLEDLSRKGNLMATVKVYHGYGLIEKIEAKKQP